jgi:UDP-3-O-acyl N-acetylglucosamine deacetylase
MHCAERQRTIARRAVVEGFGYWSGRDVRIEFRPAAPHTGIVFYRSDLSRRAGIPATIEYRDETPRRTNLRRGEVAVEMIEHVMATLAGLGVDNCEVWTDQPEMPGCDGSARDFVEAVDRAGLETQSAFVERQAILEPTFVRDGESWIEAAPVDDGQLHLEFQLDYPRHPAIGRQTASLVVSPEAFRAELADNRTFLLESEAQQLLAQGLGRRVTTSDLLLFNEHGPIDNPLRRPDECARHKALDLLGDLALGGRRLSGRIVAHRTGHRLHAELVRLLNDQFSRAALRASA